MPLNSSLYENDKAREELFANKNDQFLSTSSDIATNDNKLVDIENIL